MNSKVKIDEFQRICWYGEGFEGTKNAIRELQSVLKPYSGAYVNLRDSATTENLEELNKILLNLKSCIEVTIEQIESKTQ